MSRPDLHTTREALRQGRTSAADELAAAGLDMDRLKRDLTDRGSDIDALLKRNNEQAEAFGFSGTPSFIVGKYRVPGVLSMAEFEQVIADARKAKMN